MSRKREFRKIVVMKAILYLGGNEFLPVLSSPFSDLGEIGMRSAHNAVLHVCVS